MNTSKNNKNRFAGEVIIHECVDADISVNGELVRKRGDGGIHTQTMKKPSSTGFELLVIMIFLTLFFICWMVFPAIQLPISIFAILIGYWIGLSAGESKRSVTTFTMPSVKTD